MPAYFFDSSALVKRIRLNLSSLTLVASDMDLNKAAGGEGLPTDDPNLH
jgi:hypothetical protein